MNEFVLVVVPIIAVVLAAAGTVEASSLYRVGKKPLKGIPFNEETVRGYLQDPTITEAARLCIALTWEHREKLGIPGVAART